MTTEHAPAGNAGRGAPYGYAGATLALVQRSNNGTHANANCRPCGLTDL